MVRHGKGGVGRFAQRGDSGRMTLLCCEQEPLPPGRAGVGQLRRSGIPVTDNAQTQPHADRLDSAEEMDT